MASASPPLGHNLASNPTHLNTTRTLYLTLLSHKYQQDAIRFQLSALYGQFLLANSDNDEVSASVRLMGHASRAQSPPPWLARPEWGQGTLLLISTGCDKTPATGRAGWKTPGEENTFVATLISLP